MSPLTKEDVLIIFNDKTLFVVNLVVRTTTFLQNFIVDEWPEQQFFLPALRVTDKYACGP